MYETLLFLHVLSAFLLVATIVVHSAVALGTPVSARGMFVADRLWDVGGLGTLVFGVWIALREDVYDITDGWILAAIVLWAIATELGRRGRIELEPALAGASPDASAVVRTAATMHWLRTVVTLLLLIDMIWKPGA